MGEHCKHEAFREAHIAHVRKCKRCLHPRGKYCATSEAIMREHGAIGDLTCGCWCPECQKCKKDGMREDARPVREIQPSAN